MEPKRVTVVNTPEFYARVQGNASQIAIWFYLVSRQSKGLPAATRKDMVQEIGLSERTLDRNLAAMKEAGVLIEV